VDVEGGSMKRAVWLNEVPYVQVLELIRNNELAYPGSLKCMGHRSIHQVYAEDRKELALGYVLEPVDADLTRFLKYQRKILVNSSPDVTATVNHDMLRFQLVTLTMAVWYDDRAAMYEAQEVARAYTIKTKNKGPATYVMDEDDTENLEDRMTKKLWKVFNPSRGIYDTATTDKRRIYNVPVFIQQVEARLWTRKYDR
jgi:hypothetical protein